MRYSSRHKDDTHARIVAAASRGFRARGFAGLGVAALMSELGLTHGGFYAHFPTKDALVVAACERALADLWTDLETELEGGLEDGLEDGSGQTPGRSVERFARAYLAPGHRRDVARGCPIVALGAEIARATPVLRRAVARDVGAGIGRLAAAMPAPTPRQRHDAATLLLSTLVGTLLVSRLLPAAAGVRSLAVTRRVVTLAAHRADARGRMPGPGPARAPSRRRRRSRS